MPRYLSHCYLFITPDPLSQMLSEIHHRLCSIFTWYLLFLLCSLSLQMTSFSRYVSLQPKSSLLLHIFSFHLLYIPFQTTGSMCFSFTISLYPMPLISALMRTSFLFLRLPSTFLYSFNCSNPFHLYCCKINHILILFPHLQTFIDTPLLTEKFRTLWRWHSELSNFLSACLCRFTTKIA